jgi:hypothetical protein
MNKQAEKLADFIEKNPHCKFEIDNDGWYILGPKKEGNNQPDDLDYGENQIADDSDYSWNTEWYSHSSNYGAGLAEALVILLNRRGFKIEASAV